MQSYDAGPHLGAWALAAWSHKTGQFTDPGHAPEWVFVVGTAPTGLHGSHVWKPPTTVIVQKSRTSPQKTMVVRHVLRYQDLGEPFQVWGTLKSGHNVAFIESASAGPGAKVPTWSGGLVWGAKVPLTGPKALKSITARWTSGQIETIPWPEAAGSSGGTVWHLLTNPQAIKKWWPDIQAAARVGRRSHRGQPVRAGVSAHADFEQHRPWTSELRAGVANQRGAEPAHGHRTAASGTTSKPAASAGTRPLPPIMEVLAAWRSGDSAPVCRGPRRRRS
ncbi:MAG: hypothetical protein M0Z36_02655 [Thermaerobacter sp.]|nr:hypothetical protein [Thermaerobacter sp.]